MRPCNRRFRFLIPLFILACVALLSLAVMGLWNRVLTHVLPVPPITYLQAAGILILSKILFGGFPGRGKGFCGGMGCGNRWGGRHMTMELWDSLTPEQREQFRQKMRPGFGNWNCPPAPPPPPQQQPPAPPQNP